MSQPFIHRPYGVVAQQFLQERPRANLFAPPGFGKTGITLSVIDGRILAGYDKPTLIVAPKRVARDTWANEAAKWDEFKHLTIRPIIGSPMQRKQALRADVPIHTINYEGLQWLEEELHGVWPWGAVVCDESSRVKSHRTRQGSKRARVLARVAHRQVDYWTNLTGTPCSNGLKDLWGQQWFVDGGAALGANYSAFTDRFFRPNRNGFGFTPVNGAEENIRKAIAPTSMSLRVEDWFDIKQPIVNTVEIELPALARRHYKELEDEMLTKLLEGKHTVEAINAAVLTGKALQCCSGQFYADGGKSWVAVHDEKLQALESIINESGGEQVMVVYEFRSARDRIMKLFGTEAVDLSTKEGFKRFMAGDAQVGVAASSALGHGIDGLQNVCRTIVHFDMGWNLENYLQINERIGPVRQLQANLHRNVYIHHIVAHNTIDQVVLARRESKKSVQDILLEYLRAS